MNNYVCVLEILNEVRFETQLGRWTGIQKMLKNECNIIKFDNLGVHACVLCSEAP